MLKMCNYSTIICFKLNKCMKFFLSLNGKTALTTCMFGANKISERSYVRDIKL